MTKPQNNEEQKSRVDSVHGGQVVENITEDELVSVNDAECKHEKLVLDPTEKDFRAFMCANPNCGVVVLYNKQ